MGEDELTLFALAETTKMYTGTKKKAKGESQKKKNKKKMEREVTFEEYPKEVDDEAKEMTVSSDEKLVAKDDEPKKSSLKSRLSMVKLRMPRPNFSRLTRPDFSRILVAPSLPRFREGLNKVNCFKVEEDEAPVLENMDMERHKSIDLGLRRSSLYFFRRKASVCQHPYHPYTPKQSTRLVWNSHHYKS